MNVKRRLIAIAAGLAGIPASLTLLALLVFAILVDWPILGMRVITGS